MRDLIEPGMKIEWDGLNGKPVGTVKYIADYTPQYEEGQKYGHFFPVQFKPKYYQKNIRIGSQGGVGGKVITPSEADPYLIIRVENCTVDRKISAIVDNTKEKIFEIDFNSTTLPSGEP